MTVRISTPNFLREEADDFTSRVFAMGYSAGEVIGWAHVLDLAKQAKAEKEAKGDEVAVAVIDWLIDRTMAELDYEEAVENVKSTADSLVYHWEGTPNGKETADGKEESCCGGGCCS